MYKNLVVALVAAGAFATAAYAEPPKITLAEASNTCFMVKSLVERALDEMNMKHLPMQQTEVWRNSGDAKMVLIALKYAGEWAADGNSKAEITEAVADGCMSKFGYQKK